MNYSIKLIFKSKLSISQENEFEAAASKWSSIIVSDRLEPDMDYIEVIIDSTCKKIKENIIGKSAPLCFRVKSGLPYKGIISLNSMLIEKLEYEGELSSTIVHELGHVLGFGNLWKKKGLIIGLETNAPIYIGQNAVNEYRKLKNDYSLKSIPVENSGGLGTKHVHWDESEFHNELMTGWPDKGWKFPMSKLTIAAFEDLGYIVDYSKAEYYSLQPYSLLTKEHWKTRSFEDGIVRECRY